MGRRYFIIAVTIAFVSCSALELNINNLRRQTPPNPEKKKGLERGCFHPRKASSSDKKAPLFHQGQGTKNVWTKKSLQSLLVPARNVVPTRDSAESVPKWLNPNEILDESLSSSDGTSDIYFQRSVLESFGAGEADNNTVSQYGNTSRLPPPVINTFKILETIPHDTSAFTQGLTFDPQRDDIVYESTGLYLQSDVRIVNITNGQVIQLWETPPSLFGEGLAFYTTKNNETRLIHITFEGGKGFLFDAASLTVLGEFTFTTSRNEGWGITYNPNTDQFIVTDGSQYLHIWNASNLQEVSKVEVTILMPTKDGGYEPQVLVRLNELEWDNSTQTVLANVWNTDMIVRIDPITGSVVTVYDLSALYTNRIPGADVFNGIALSPSNELWVTGKNWPFMYKIELAEA